MRIEGKPFDNNIASLTTGLADPVHRSEQLRRGYIRKITASDIILRLLHHAYYVIAAQHNPFPGVSERTDKALNQVISKIIIS